VTLPSSTASPASWARVRAVVRPHDGWGIRAIVAAPSALLAPAADQHFAETWDVVPDDPGAVPTIDISVTPAG